MIPVFFVQQANVSQLFGADWSRRSRANARGRPLMIFHRAGARKVSRASARQPLTKCNHLQLSLEFRVALAVWSVPMRQRTVRGGTPRTDELQQL